MLPQVYLEGLLAVLASLCRKHEKYLELALLMRSALVENQVFKLQEINQQMEILADEVLVLDQRRVDYMEELAAYFGKEVHTIQDLSALIKDFSTANILVQRATELREIVKKCHNCNRTNEALLAGARDLIRVGVEAVLGLTERQGGKVKFQTYGASGGFVKSQPVSSLRKWKG